MKPKTTKPKAMNVILSIFLSSASSNFVVKKATASAMKTPAPIGTNVVNSAKGISEKAASCYIISRGLTTFAAASPAGFASSQGRM